MPPRKKSSLTKERQRRSARNAAKLALSTHTPPLPSKLLPIRAALRAAAADLLVPPPLPPRILSERIASKKKLDAIAKMSREEFDSHMRDFIGYEKSLEHPEFYVTRPSQDPVVTTNKTKPNTERVVLRTRKPIMIDDDEPYVYKRADDAKSVFLNAKNTHRSGFDWGQYHIQPSLWDQFLGDEPEDNKHMPVDRSAPFVPYQQIILQPGHYSISFRLDCIYERKGEDGFQKTFVKNVVVRRVKILAKPTVLSILLRDLTEEYIEKYGLDQYYFAVNSVTDVQTPLFRVEDDPLFHYIGTILQPGTYGITYNMKFSYKQANKYGVMTTYPSKDVLNAFTKILAEPTPLATLIAVNIDWYEMHNHLEQYDFTVISVTDATAVPVEERAQDLLPMGGAQLHYDFLGNLKLLNPVPGQCVIDFIYSTIALDRSIPGKHCIRQPEKEELIAFFGGRENIVNGVNTKQIMAWAASVKYVSCYALDPLLQRFSHYVAKETTMHVLVFVVNNAHCYPVVDQRYKDNVVNLKRIELDSFKFDVKFEDYKYISLEDIEMRWEDLKDGIVEGDVVLIGTDNLKKLSIAVTSKTDNLVYNMKLADGKVTCFEHPTTKKIYIGAEDYEERIEACSKFYAIHRCSEFKFVNQSFSQLARSLFEIKYGIIKQSEFSPSVAAILDASPVRPYIAKLRTRHEYDISELVAFDMVRCYSGILIKNKVDYNVFYAFDHPIVFVNNGLPLEYGEYYVNRDFYLGHGTIRIVRGWYPLVLVDYALKKGVIVRGDIAYWIKASYHLPHDTFKDFVEDIIKVHHDEDGRGSSVAKKLVNSFIGSLNHQYIKSEKGCITGDYDCAMGVVFSEQAKGRTPIVSEVSGLYFVKSEFKTRKTQTNSPIRRCIMAQVYMEMDALYEVACGDDPNAVAVAWNVDCLKVFRPKYVEFKEDKDLVPGDYQLEEVKPIKGNFIDQLDENPLFVYNNPEWTRLGEHDSDNGDGTRGNLGAVLNVIKTSSCCITGEPGCGKSHALLETAREDSVAHAAGAHYRVLTLGYTHAACENLKDRGVENVHTHDSFLSEHATFEAYVEKIKKFKCVNLEEFGMTPSKYLARFINIKHRLGLESPIFRLFGDTTQNTPFEARTYDYDNSPLVKELCGGKLITLKYKPGVSRYDGVLRDFLVEFKREKYLPIIPGMISGDYYMNITQSNNKRIEVNANCLARFIREFAPEVCVIGATTWAVGMPVIAIDNVYDVPKKVSLTIFNAQTFTLVRFTDSLVILSRPGVVAGTTIYVDVKMEYFNSIIAPGFAVTITRFQAKSINTHFTIHEIEKMSLNAAYTAISRATLLSYVHYTHTDQKFYKERPSGKSDLVILKQKQMINGIVYKITDPENSFFYIGRTEKTAEARLAEHRREPTNDAMAAVIQNPDVTIEVLEKIRCTSLDSLLRLEGSYITEFMNDENTKHKLLNSQRPKIHVPMKVTIIQPIPEKKRNFEIMHDVETKTLSIDARVEIPVIVNGFGRGAVRGPKTKRVRKEMSYSNIPVELQPGPKKIPLFADVLAIMVEFRRKALLEYGGPNAAETHNLPFTDVVAREYVRSVVNDDGSSTVFYKNKRKRE
jgi:purine-nucleoside phosphorylase